MSTYIIATIVPKPDHVRDVENALREMVEKTRKEPGNRRYDLFREDRADGGVKALHLYEIYIDRSAFDRHIASDHFQAFKAKLGDWLAEAPEIRVVEGIDVAP